MPLSSMPAVPRQPELVLRLELHPLATVANPKREARLQVYDPSGALAAEYHRPPREMALVFETLLVLHAIQRVTCNDPQDHLRLFELPHLRQLINRINDPHRNGPLTYDSPAP